MIEPKELRIGNKLQKDNGEVYTILRLDNTQDVLVEEQRGLLTLNYNLFGIPITEDWLLKLGFEKRIIDEENGGYWFISDIKLWFNHGEESDVSFCTIHDYEGLFKSGYAIDHIHQLQNLFHALTGEELKIVE